VHKRALVRQLVSITRPLLSIDRDGNSTSLTRSHSSLSVRIACCIIMCMRHRSAILSTQTHTLIKRPAPTQQFFCNATPALREKRINLNPAQLLLRHVRVFFLPPVVGRSRLVQPAPTRLLPGLFSRKYTHTELERRRALFFFLPLSRLNRRCSAG
jgi:hypothetical protein